MPATKDPGPIAQRRRALGWTQFDLARASGLTSNFVSTCETGWITTPRVHNAIKLARALGVDTVAELDLMFPDPAHKNGAPRADHEGRPNDSAGRGRHAAR